MKLSELNQLDNNKEIRDSISIETIPSKNVFRNLIFFTGILLKRIIQQEQ